MKADFKRIIQRLEKLIVYLEMSATGSKQDIANVLDLSSSALSKAIYRNFIPYEKFMILLD